MKKLKKYQKKIYNKIQYFKIKRLLNSAVCAWIQEDYESAYTADKQIVNLLRTKLKRGKHLTLLELLVPYINALNVINRYQIDQDIENRSITLYTDYLLSEENIFSNKTVAFNDFLIALMKANINAHRLSSFQLLYSTYGEAFKSDLKKCQLLLMIATGVCGDFPMEEVQKLFDNFSERKQMYEKRERETAGNPEEFQKVKNRKRRYLRHLYDLSDRCQVQIEGLESSIITELQQCESKYAREVYLLCSIIADKGIFHETVQDWIDRVRVEDKEIEEIQLKSLEKLELLIKQSKNANVERLALEEISGYEEITTLAEFNKMIVDRRYPRKYVYQAALSFYAQLERKVKARFKKLRLRIKLLGELYSTKINMRPTAYWAHFEETLEKLPAAQESDTVYFFINDHSLVNATVSLPFLLEAKRHGYFVAPTSPRTFFFSETKDQELNDLAGAMNSDIDIRFERKRICKYDWKIDIKNKRIEAEGMNIYQPIYEFVSRYQFSYFFNYDTNFWARNKTHALIRTMDRIFQYCEQVEQWAMRNNKKVRFIAHAPHVNPTAAYRIYCETKGYKHNMEYIVVSAGYDNYFKNIGDAKTETVTALNMTRHPYSRNAFLGTKEGFERYYQENRQRLAEVRKKTEVWLQYQRSDAENGQSSERKNRILRRIKEYKSAGKRVYLLNGKVVFDLGVKYTKGCAHDDMCHWITHTVDTINNNPDILLLIKPHPHETRKDLTMTTQKMTVLKDLIKIPMAENVIYLEPSDFKISELIDYLDLGILWNGTSALEFAAQGLKTLMGDIWGHYDYPIGFLRVNSLQEYEHFLEHPEDFTSPQDLADKAMMFLEYMGSESVRIRNPYAKTSSLNFHQFDSVIYDDEVDRYIEKGDEALKDLFNKIDK